MYVYICMCVLHVRVCTIYLNILYTCVYHTCIIINIYDMSHAKLHHVMYYMAYFSSSILSPMPVHLRSLAPASSSRSPSLLSLTLQVQGSLPRAAHETLLFDTGHRPVKANAIAIQLVLLLRVLGLDRRNQGVEVHSRQSIYDCL